MLTVEDIYVPFIEFVSQVMMIEEMPEFNVNMFTRELSDPKNYYVLRYPYKYKAESRTELTARLGIATDTVIDLNTYNTLVTRDDIRLILSTDRVTVNAFQSTDKIIVEYVPDSLPPFFECESLMQQFMDAVEFGVTCYVASANEALGNREFTIGTVSWQYLNSYKKGLARQLSSPKHKVVYVYSPDSYVPF